MDATQALTLIIVAVIVRDGLLGWALINWVIRASTPTQAVPGGPGGPAEPGTPPVVIPPVVIPPGPPVVTPPPDPAPAVPLSSGKGSWYSQYQGKFSWVDDGDKPNSNALGVPDPCQGVSFYNKATLGQWIELHAPNGTVSIEQQTDIGPNPSTGRTIDISAACAERIGYSPQNFPTDGIFQWRPVPAPAAVANLLNQAQAVAYQKIRSSVTPPVGPATPPVSTGDPQWITLGRTYVEKLTWSQQGGPMPAQMQAWMDNISTTFPEMAPYCKVLKNLGAKGWWAWCGFFVQAMLSYSHIRGPMSAAGLQGQTTTDDWAYAKSWADWGTDASDNPQPGDVLVWDWGHVSFYDHPEPTSNDYASLGGDQGTPLRVCLEDISMGSCIAIRRPPAPTA